MTALEIELNNTIEGYPVEYLVMIARIAASQKITPEDAMKSMLDVEEITKLVFREIKNAQEKAIMSTMLKVGDTWNQTDGTD